MSELLAVPVSEASAATARIDGAIGQIETAISTRSARATECLGSWRGRNRVAWDEQFGYSQGDLAVALDDLQTVRAEIAARLREIEAHNDEMRAARADIEGGVPWMFPVEFGGPRP
jgi:hypothetical protein